MKNKQALKNTLIIMAIVLGALALAIFYPMIAGGILVLTVAITFVIAVIQALRS